MAIIKSYTDIEQSKKLADIFPLESADMYHFIDGIDKIYKVGFGYSKANADYYSKTKLEYIPCWSLVALLSALPEIQGSKPSIALNYNYITYPCVSDLHTEADNLVDACVAMIEKLHELNLL